MARYEDRGLRLIPAAHITPAGLPFNLAAAHKTLLEALPVDDMRRQVQTQQKAVQTRLAEIRKQERFLNAPAWERARLWQNANPRAEDWMLAALHKRMTQTDSRDAAFDSFENDMAAFLQRARKGSAQLEAETLARQIRLVYDNNPDFLKKPPGRKRLYNALWGLKDAMPQAERTALAKAAVLSPAGTVSTGLRQHQDAMLRDIGFIASYAAGNDPARAAIIPQEFSDLSKKLGRLRRAEKRLTGKNSEARYAKKMEQRFFYVDDVALFGGGKSFTRTKLNRPQRAALITLLKNTERTAGQRDGAAAVKNVMDAIKFITLDGHGRTGDVIATLDHLARNIQSAREKRSRFYPLTGRSAWRDTVSKLCTDTRTHLNYHALSCQNAALRRALTDTDAVVDAVNRDYAHISTKGRNDYHHFKMASTVLEPLKQAAGALARTAVLSLAFLAASEPAGQAATAVREAEQARNHDRYSDTYMRLLDYRLQMELRIVEGLRDYNTTQIATGHGPVGGLQSSYTIPRPLAAIIYRHLPSLQPAGYSEAAYTAPTIERETTLTPERIAAALTALPVTQQDDVRFALATELRDIPSGKFLGDQLFRAPSAVENFMGQTRPAPREREDRAPQRGVVLSAPTMLAVEDIEDAYRVRPGGEPETRP